MLERLMDLWRTSRGFRTGSLVSLSGLAGLALVAGLMRAGQAGNDPANDPDDPFADAPGVPGTKKTPARQDRPSAGPGPRQRNPHGSSPPVSQGPANTAAGTRLGDLTGRWSREIQTRDQLLAYTVEFNLDGTGEEIYNDRGASAEITYKYTPGATPNRGTLEISAINPRNGKAYPRETGDVSWRDADHFSYRITSTTKSVNERGWKFNFQRH
jgi:hypothetical protein